MVDRIKALLQERQLSTTQFADLVGVARPIVSHILSERNKPSLEVVQRILAAFPNLSMAWLLNGTGPMWNGGELPATAAPAAPAASATPSVSIPATSASIAAQIPVEELVSNSVAATAPIQSSAPIVVEPAQVPAAAVPLTHLSTPPTPALAPLPQVSPTAPPTAPRPLLQPRQRFTPVAAAPAAQALADAPVPDNAAALPAAPVPQQPPLAPTPAPPLLPTAPDTPAIAAPVPAVAAAAVPAGGKAIRRIVLFYQDGSFADFAPEQGI